MGINFRKMSLLPLLRMVWKEERLETGGHLGHYCNCPFERRWRLHRGSAGWTAEGSRSRDVHEGESTGEKLDDAGGREGVVEDA